MRALLVALALVLVPAPARAAVDFPGDSGFTPTQRQEISRVVDAADGSVVVRVLADLPPRAHGSARIEAAQLRAVENVSDPAVLVWGGDDALPAFGVAGDGEVHCAREAVRRSRFDEHQQFVELVRLVAAGTGCAAMDDVLAERFRDSQPATRGGGIVERPADAITWLSRALVILTAVALLGALVFFIGRRWRDARQRKRRSEALTGLASDAARLSAGEQAHADLLAFGEQVDHTEILPGHRMQLWQLALDEYDEACRLHDARRGDHRVIELCASGRLHLQQAIGARPA